MSEPALLEGQYINIMMGDGATPTELFTMLCGMTTRNFTEQSNTTDVFVRDCALPDAKPRRRVQITGEQWDMSGAGLLNRSQLAIMRGARGVKKNYRFQVAQPTGDAIAGGHYGGAAVLESIQYTGEDGAFATVNLAFKSDGAWTWTVVP